MCHTHPTQIIFSLFFLLLFCVYESRAQTTEDIFSLSLEELLNLRVSIASTESESILETPAVVSTISLEEAKQQGARTLSEAMSLIPGIVINEGTFGNSTVMIRGVTEAFGSKILFLLDGVPYWSPSHNAIPLLSIPLESVDRLEVIRGPGAVIYGTNAISGVINVITRIQGGVVTSTLGSHAQRNISFSWTNIIDNESRVTISAEHQRQDGYLGEYIYQDTILYMPRRKETTSAMVNYADKHLNLLFHVFDETVQGRNPPSTINNSPLYDIPLFVSNEGYLAHGDYRWIYENASLKLFSDYNSYSPTFDRSFERTLFDNSGKDNFRWRTGVEFSRSLESFSGLSVLTGVEYERRNIGNYESYLPDDLNSPNAVIIESDSTSEKTNYLQLDYSLDKWRFLLGARWTDNEKSGTKMTPRASLVYSLDQRQSLKFLYSVGFTSPNFVHTSINLPNTVVGNSELVAETITTFDMVYSYTAPKILFMVNAYAFDGEDFITTVDNPVAPGTTYINANKFTRKGLEVDFKYKHGDWSLNSNASFNHEGNRKILNDPNAINVPRWVVNLGGTYNINEWHLLGSKIQSISARNNADSYLSVDFNYEYHDGNFEGFVTLKNLTSSVAHNPDATTGTPDLLHPKFEDKLNYLIGIRYHL